MKYLCIAALIALSSCAHKTRFDAKTGESIECTRFLIWGWCEYPNRNAQLRAHVHLEDRGAPH